MNISPESALSIGFILHLVGDYLLQNDWMAQNKTKSTIPCLVHCLLYTGPFYFLVGNTWPLFIIFWSHFSIDRFRLAVYWIKFVNWNWSSKNFGYSMDKPAWMSVWLMIIIDNVFHIIINSLCIYWAFSK